MNKLNLRKILKIKGSLELSGSKSISNRILLLSSLGKGIIKLKNLLDCADVKYMYNALVKLGVSIEKNNRGEYTLRGCGGPLPKGEFELYLGNAGTAMRSLTAAFCAGYGKFTLMGDERMHNRPIIDLVKALNKLGTNVKFIGSNPNCPPLCIYANGLSGGKTIVNGSISSQYLSALLMIAPYAKNDVTIKVSGFLTSKPYVKMTMQLMKKFGVSIKHKNYREFFIFANQIYQNPQEFFIEGDASTASYFLAMAALKGEVTLSGYGKDSIQGEANFANILVKMGAKIQWKENSIFLKRTQNLQAIDVDMNGMTDTAMTLSVIALFAKGTTKIKNIANWQLKESPRITAVANELRKCGAIVEEGKDFLLITPPQKLETKKIIEIETYNDHRMAMAFSLLATEFENITILNPQCTEKTVPNFFNLLNSISLNL